MFLLLFFGSMILPSLVSTSRSDNDSGLHFSNPLPSSKRKRNPAGTPDPNLEVVALSPKTLLATNRFICEICQKGFPRDQNLELHRRSHNLPWKLKQQNSRNTQKKVYICPETTCIHHDPSRALGDITGIKKHFSRKHGEKKWKCPQCPKVYAVLSDYKAHIKKCGIKEYKCDCGTIFSRRDSFTTHQAFCEANIQENARISASVNSFTHPASPPPPSPSQDSFQIEHPILADPLFSYPSQPYYHRFMLDASARNRSIFLDPPTYYPNTMLNPLAQNPNPIRFNLETTPSYHVTSPTPAHPSATMFLHKAALFGSYPTDHVGPSTASSEMQTHFTEFAKVKHLTRDFLGLTTEDRGRVVEPDLCVGLREILEFGSTSNLMWM